MGKTTTEQGAVAHPEYKVSNKENRVGETKVANNGMQMTLITYRSSHDIDVQFSDGYIRYHTTYYAFVNGKVGHPDTTLNAKAANNHYGETAISKHGRLMKIIRWGNKVDIDVEFEDGYVAKNRRYFNFRRGSIGHPGDISIQFTDNRGVTSTSNKGQKMTVEVYRNSHDVDIRFEDGTLVTHKKYGDFVKGLIANPNYIGSKYNGKSIISHDGIDVKVIGVVENKMHLQYETGYTTTKECRTRTFKNYRLKHPFPYQIGSVSMDKPAYIYAGTGNFYCHCTKCGLEDIMTVQEMREHICR